eukprot:GHVU01212965.1.p1 GENE.GHVU01212965.1~~GHVU01212965.1.p1  ORF type:complete len:188 (+),score=20.73 GHVU01212965.1:540-1103(+)
MIDRLTCVFQHAKGGEDFNEVMDGWLDDWMEGLKERKASDPRWSTSQEHWAEETRFCCACCRRWCTYERSVLADTVVSECCTNVNGTAAAAPYGERKRMCPLSPTAVESAFPSSSSSSLLIHPRVYEADQMIGQQSVLRYVCTVGRVLGVSLHLSAISTYAYIYTYIRMNAWSVWIRIKMFTFLVPP